MAANTDTLDYFSRGEPVRRVVGKVSTTGLDVFSLGEPYRAALVAAAGGPTVPMVECHNTIIMDRMVRWGVAAY